MYNSESALTIQLHPCIIEIDTQALSYTRQKLFASFLRADLQLLEKEKHYFLHGKEIEKCTTYTSPLRKQSYLLGRIAAKEAIQAYLGNGFPYHEINIENGLSGEPNVMDRNIHISISHSNDYAICIATSFFIKIGVDIECLDNIREREVAVSIEEIGLFKQVGITDTVLAYGLLWTAKESLVKCLGIGFIIPLHLLTIAHIGMQNDHIMVQFTYFPTFQVLLSYTSYLVIAICVPKKVGIQALEDLLKKLK